MAGTLIGLTSDQAAIVQSGARIQQLTNQARLETESYQLELDLFKNQIGAEKAQLTTSFGLYRRYRSYDAWRAKALLDNARRYALAARRGIEAHDVVDLSRVTQNEAFVASPSVGGPNLRVRFQPAGSRRAVNWARNAGWNLQQQGRRLRRQLEQFRGRFRGDSPVCSCRGGRRCHHHQGPRSGQELDFDDGSGEVIPTFPTSGTWQVNCPDSGWGSVPPVASGGAAAACIDLAACGCPAGDLDCLNSNTTCPKPRPVAARVVFSLDPWVGVNELSLAEPYDARYNARWSRLAVNLVGTGIRDCKLAADPLSCYGEGFLPFNLPACGTGMGHRLRRAVACAGCSARAD